MNLLQHMFLFAGVLFLAFFAVSYFFQRLKIPSLLAYLLLGVLMAGLLTPEEYEVTDKFGKIGIVFLFFLLGMSFPVNRLVNIAGRVWRVGLMDIVLNFGISAVFAYLFGLGVLPALIIGGVAYATSSSITVKMLEDAKRINAAESEFQLALLIFEDIAAPVMVSVLFGLTLQGEVTVGALAWVSFKVVAVTGVSIAAAYYLFRRFEMFFKRGMTKEFIPLLAIAVTFLWAGVAEYLGLSKLLGAFLAGVMLSETGAARNLGRMLSDTKDITLPFFFFAFGASISMGAIMSPLLLLVLIVWAVIAKLMVGYWGGRMYGLSFEGSIRAAFSLIQRGEFSVVIAAIASPALREFLGVYIMATALIGVFLFRQAPNIARRIAAAQAKLKRR